MNQLNKQEAAEFLGVGVRSLERYTKANRVAARYEKGKTGNVLLYDRADLERFKAELESATHLPTVERAAEAPINRMETPRPNTDSLANSANGLARLGEGHNLNVDGIALALLEAMARLQPAASDLPTAPDASAYGAAPAMPIAQKLLLSLAEAQLYSGLSRANLLEAIGTQTLLAQKIGRGWKIKRRDLESYIDNL